MDDHCEKPSMSILGFLGGSMWNMERQAAVVHIIPHNYRRQQKTGSRSLITRCHPSHWLTCFPATREDKDAIKLVSWRKRSPAYNLVAKGEKNRKNVLTEVTSLALMAFFPAETYISCPKLGFSALDGGRGRAPLLHMPKRRSKEQTAYLLLSFCFETAAYCAPLLLPSTGG